MSARTLEADACRQIRHRILGLPGYSRGCHDRRLVVLDRHRPRGVRAQFLRPPHLRLPDRREGHRRLEVDGVGKVVVVHEGRPGLPGQQAAVAAIGVAQPEDVAAAVEVGLDVHPQLFALDRTAHVEEQARLARMELRVAALAPIDGDGARIEGILGADRIEVADDVELDPPSDLEGNPPIVNPSGFGTHARWAAAAAAAPPSRLLAPRVRLSTGELVCALAEPIAQQEHCRGHESCRTLVSNRSRCHRWCSDLLTQSIQRYRRRACVTRLACQRVSLAGRLRWLFGALSSANRRPTPRGESSRPKNVQSQWLCWRLQDA